MRIGLVCYPTFGGSGVVATELAATLAARGHDVHLVSYALPARFPKDAPRLSFHEVAVSSYPLFRYPPYDVALASRLAEVAEEAALDVLHVHYAIPHAVSAVLVQDVLRPRPLPVVTTLHGTDITVIGQDPAYRRITRHAVERSNVVTAVSQHLADETHAVLGTERPIDVVPNFVDLERFRPRTDASRRNALTGGAGALLMHVGNYRPVKRAHLCIEAFAAVAAEMPATLVMVGDGPERPRCEARAKELGLGTRVRFLGPQAGIEELLPAADVFLLPSRFESFGLAALEAMACGVVPVATRAGGLPEVVRDGVDGLLVPDPEMAQLGERLVALLAEPARVEALGAAAREAAETRFPPTRAVDAYEALYRRAVDAAASASAKAQPG